MKVDLDALMDAISLGRLKTVRELIAGTIDFIWLYKAIFESFVANYCKTADQKAEVSVIVGRYLAQDTTVADRQINFDCCVLEIMVAMDRKIKFNK